MTKLKAAACQMTFAAILVMSTGVVLPAIAQQGSTAAVQGPGILKPADMANLMPEQVFFRGQSATVQMRNSGGLRYADGVFTLVALVDTSGYSSGIQQRYQAYLITEVPLQLGNGAGAHKLEPGAYGVGFIQNDRFVVMDLGAHELLNVGSQQDPALRRAMPLQVLDAPEAGSYRFYEGRSYVTMRRAQ
jgi:hypothetical protein